MLDDPSCPGCRPADRHDERNGVMADGVSDGGRGRDCQHYRMVTTFQRRRAGRSRRLTSLRKLGVPQSLWPAVASRLRAGESLRMLAREYGVSHECIRRTARDGGQYRMSQ